MVAILHNIRSLFNVGSMFRTADAAGIEKLYLCGITPTPFDVFGKPRAQIVKVALGAEKSVPWEKIRRTSDAIKRAKREGYTVLAVELSPRAIPYYQYAMGKKKICLVVGHEVNGLSSALMKRCDAVLEIPMYGKKESLNVGVAFGIVAFGLKHRT